MKHIKHMGVASTLLAALLLSACASKPTAEQAAQQEAAKQEAQTSAEAAKKAEVAPVVVPQAQAQFADAKPQRFVQQTYSTANTEGVNYELQFLKGNKVVYKTTDDSGKPVQYRGTWKRTNNQIDIDAKGTGTDESVQLSYEVRPALNSAADQYKDCKKFAPGLYPLSVNGSTDEDLTYSLWPANLVKKHAAPCEPERKQATKGKGKRK